MFFYGLALVVNANTAGTAIWGGSGGALPEQGTGSGTLPHLLVTTLGRVGIGDQNPAQALCVTGDCVVSGSITGAWKSFDIQHQGKDGYRLRHWCIEGDAPGGSLLTKAKSQQSSEQMCCAWGKLSLLAPAISTCKMKGIAQP